MGENFADIIGINAAYHAYKEYEFYNGPDPAINDSHWKQLTNDQLFFLSYAQDWCNSDYEQVNVHAPGWARIKGPIQDFPAFRVAFNCPAGGDYTPKKRCSVWTSEPKPG
jgi:endothelin-converting enzyme